MKKTDWKGIGEFVGISAIVASLIFVGFQLKQDRDVALAETTHSFMESSVEVNAMLAEHADVWLKGRNGDDLSEEEMVVMERLVDSLYRRARYTSQMHRTLGLAGGAQLRDLAIMLYENPGARKAWDQLTEQEVIYFRQMRPSDDFRHNYRQEVLAELAKLDELND
jgi:hypothetical protein